MPPQQPEFVQRASIEGELCTVRRRISEGVIPNSKGEWLGVEWDNPNRGKHNGTYKGERFFHCQSQKPNVASFIKASRKFDDERTVIEAIHYKYGGADNDNAQAKDLVVISGKVAEEVGFDKIAQEQGVLENLKIVVLEKLTVCGIAPRDASKETLQLAQRELAATCPNIIELDLSYNTIEKWSDIRDICVALPRLRILRLNGLRFHLTTYKPNVISGAVFANIQELHLNDCLLGPAELFTILGPPSNLQLPNLSKLWLSQNDLQSFAVPENSAPSPYDSITELIMEYNSFNSLDSLENIMATFPKLKTLSFQHNQISVISTHSNSKGRSSIISQPVLESLSVSHNRISSFDFIDELSIVLPNLTSLRISQNPLYYTPQSSLPTANPSETNYYLTLARMPKLKMLNYTHITTREREEGEIYYLSVVEQDIRAQFSSVERDSLEARTSTMDMITRKFPKYQMLCEKYDREPLTTTLLSTSSGSHDRLLEKGKIKNPPGSIAANLVETKFYIPTTSIKTKGAKPTGIDKSLTQLIPHSIPTSQVFALVARSFNLAPLQFKMKYESAEFDPVHEDITTRSQIYASNGTKASSAERWRSWGDWDADAIVEASLSASSDSNGNGNGNGSDNGTGNDNDNDNDNKKGDSGSDHDKVERKSRNENENEDEDLDRDEKWTADGYLLRQGKRWKRREVDILMGLRNWVDWLDGDIDSVTIRVEPYY